MKPLQQYFLMVLFVCSSNFLVCGRNPMVWPFKWNLFSSTFTWYYLYAVLTFESVDKLLWCDHPNETSSAVLLHGTIYLGCSSNYQAFGRNPIVWHSKSNLFSSTFTWSLLCFGILQNFNKKLAPLGLKWKSVARFLEPGVSTIWWWVRLFGVLFSTLQLANLVLKISLKNRESLNLMWCYMDFQSQPLA